MADTTVALDHPFISKNMLWWANVQRKICPARFFWMMHSTFGIWTLPAGVFRGRNHLVEIYRILTELAKKPLGKGQGSLINVLPDLYEDDDSILIRVDFFTPTIYFLDVLKIWVPKTINHNKSLVLLFFIESSGICPLIVPGAPIISTLFCWIPFQDDKQMTRREMQMLITGFEEVAGFTTELVAQRGLRYKKGM